MIALAILLAASIFAIDVFTPFDGAIAVLYIGVVLLLAPSGRRFVLASGIVTCGLTIFAFIYGHLTSASDGAASRVAVSIVAILITTLLSIRDRASRTTLGEQARILELSHDTVIIRDPNDVIVYWNDGAEHLYGWSRAEAIGRVCDDLLRSDVPAGEIAVALATEGHWSGEVMRTRRDGKRLVLASRWLRRRDPDGHVIGVIESSADLTEQRHADAQMQASERRYRTIFDSAGFATWESDWSETMRIAREATPPGGSLADTLAAAPDLLRAAMEAATIRNANPAAALLFSAGTPEALVGSNISSRFPTESGPAFATILSALAGGATVAENEVRLLTFDGRIADIVLRVTLLPEGRNWSHVLVMAFDVTERNEARLRYDQVSAELAHAARVSMLGQLAASIAHEVNQPLTAIINYGRSARRWLVRDTPDLGEVEACIDKMVANGTRAAEVVDRVRKLARKASPLADRIDLPELIEDAMAMIQREARAHEVAVRFRHADDLPPVVADRVQVQQVLVNLLMNGIHAMREIAGRPRDLCIDASLQADGMVQVSVTDCGTGFPAGGEARIFEPFFTTKADGMGMGLSICRSIIENQGGRIAAANGSPHGAVVAFTLPVGGMADTESGEPIS